MLILLDQALDQWNCLVEQEGKNSYRILPSSSVDQKDGLQQHGLSPLAHEHAIDSCPASWREKICEWCYEVVDHCDIDRDVVGISLFYFDKYLSLQTQFAESLVQLVAMTSLYLAVKLNSTRKISVSSIVALGKGCIRVDQVLKMEICVMKKLHWHLNPPTPSIYLNVINPLIDVCAGDAQASYEISELSRYLLELSVCDGFFTDKNPSSIAYASILVATENLSSFAKIERRFREYQLDKSPHVTQLCAMRLRQVYRLAVPSETVHEEAPGSEGLSPSFVFDLHS
mmetsp:Transcript_18880/g.40475  ORF Transcript_18880/g.40475 Transcript_18880/m.40475 type:complete len:285 (+) Transcript_18880:175-1029(+)|eukprot:CAMPEP_0172546128 /NCGR_PEP_ID=MMETSP1067-20121228/15942_1 /TAXON_ID=265564 ORGANISM="Thalassiosira punctigera, Strain Tpunct2005C2" /NCGR_SAMPLE_ID=MMETSP1067 /ASSEMBLY_ACC=CAM_ASM_000444 /LENGTH=284 /DNA_ID=CAMNT_0013333009 /DNA_START=157 /DNA_END=1011 /DNA_ORIENTATION=-